MKGSGQLQKTRGPNSVRRRNIWELLDSESGNGKWAVTFNGSAEAKLKWAPPNCILHDCTAFHFKLSRLYVIGIGRVAEYVANFTPRELSSKTRLLYFKLKLMAFTCSLEKMNNVDVEILQNEESSLITAIKVSTRIRPRWAGTQITNCAFWLLNLFGLLHNQKLLARWKSGTDTKTCRK